MSACGNRACLSCLCVFKKALCDQTSAWHSHSHSGFAAVHSSIAFAQPSGFTMCT